MRKKAKYNGLSYSKLYKVYRNIINRTQKETNRQYKNYGARGIKMCDEWLNDFINFYNWAIENGYKEGLSIDRIDVNGDYEPSNCRWTDSYTQANNRTNNVMITYKGKTLTISQWSEKLGISQSCIGRRLHEGFPIEEVFSVKRASKHKLKYKNKFYTIGEISKMTGISQQAISNRINNLRWSIEKTIETPLGKNTRTKKEVE
jgi:Fic family protein